MKPSFRSALFARRFQLPIGITLVVGNLFLVATVAADDWPQWRGANRDGVWNETGIVDRLPEGRLPRKWSVPVGSGYTGPTVAENRVYLTDRQVEIEGGKEIERERVLCFDAETGNLVWSHMYDAPYEIGYKAGPRASVTVHEGLKENPVESAENAGALRDAEAASTRTLIATAHPTWSETEIDEELELMQADGSAISPIE